ncbi:interleukin-36 gamma-like isoform X2 [Monodelphis domestica]|uniref:Interleukin-1 n=2 Tax=Monodelphis domestica TaxID=13616 RepID=F6TDE0_MONDO|nr:interleukin-36 gamma-like isoform X2 [Monodelphis domestica]XP_056668163.1 interleukin-36 gamma-like isoform X2 [Monodelphis domestica]
MNGKPSALRNTSDIGAGVGILFPRNRQTPQNIDKEKVPIGEIHDVQQQVWILKGETLIAAPHEKGVNPVSLKVLPCRDDSLPKDKGDPIYLGINETDFCLCCEVSGGQPQLQLVKEDIMKLYNNPEAVKAFVFYQNRTGSTSTLESAAYPDWFISSSDKDQPIILTHNTKSQYNTAFYLDITTPNSER